MTISTADAQDAEQPPLPERTAPGSVPFSIRGAKDEETARKFGDLVWSYVTEISRYIDVSNLDGVTLANDYEQALLELDLGYQTKHQLAPTKEGAVGVAMTPSVIREGVLKSHIVLNLGIAAALQDKENDAYGLAFQTIAHECAHVELTKRFDLAFPNMLPRPQQPNLHAHARWDVILGCWDEYAASRISAPFGADPMPGYKETFISCVRDTRQKANDCIRAYRFHADHQRIFVEMYKAYGTLLKFSCYLLGTMATFELRLDDVPDVKKELDGHWFAPHFEKLRCACDDIWADYGSWESKAKFEVIGDLVDELVRDGGLLVDVSNDGKVGFEVPFTRDTMSS